MVPFCNNEQVCRRLCHRCYQRWWRARCPMTNGRLDMAHPAFIL